MVDEIIEMEWVEELPEIGWKEVKFFERFVDKLKERPGQWAVFKVLPHSQKWTSTSAYLRNFPNVRLAQRVVEGRTVVYAQWLDTDLFMLPINTRIVHCLRRLGCQTISDVSQFSRRDLLSIPNMGEKSVDLLESLLNERGHFLSETDHPDEPLSQIRRTQTKGRLTWAEPMEKHND